MTPQNLNIGVGLFVYNRPWHTQQVVNSLKINKIKKLYIFCDGTKDKILTGDIQQTRAIVQDIDWCSTKITLHVGNLGVVNNIVFGINKMFEENEAVIILEDDCVVRADFYYFMSACLNYYKDFPEVMHVSAYQFPINLKEKPSCDLYFSFRPMSWGFGLWKRSWPYFRMNIEDALDYFNRGDLERRKIFSDKHKEGIKDVIAGRINSFAYRWFFLINKNNGFCATPYESYVRNIGHDGTGVHCRKTNLNDIPGEIWNRPPKNERNPLVFPSKIVHDNCMDSLVKNYDKGIPIVNLAKKIIKNFKNVI